MSKKVSVKELEVNEFYILDEGSFEQGGQYCVLVKCESISRTHVRLIVISDSDPNEDLRWAPGYTWDLKLEAPHIFKKL